MLSAKGLDELAVGGLVAVGGKNAKVGLAPEDIRGLSSCNFVLVQSLGSLMQTTGKTVVDEGLLEDLYQV